MTENVQPYHPFSFNFYWHYEMENFNEFFELVKTDINKDNKYKNQHAWTNQCIIDVYDNLNPEKYQNYFIPLLKRLSKDIGYEFDVEITQPWINVYHRGAFQEQHHHFPHDLAMVIFLTDPDEDSGNFYFSYPGITALPTVWYNICLGLNMNERFFPNVKAGSVLLFPSHMMHGVTAHKSDKERISLSCNFEIENIKIRE